MSQIKNCAQASLELKIEQPVTFCMPFLSCLDFMKTGHLEYSLPSLATVSRDVKKRKHIRMMLRVCEHNANR
jgi:hypothetical protein